MSDITYIQNVDTNKWFRSTNHATLGLPPEWCSVTVYDADESDYPPKEDELTYSQKYELLSKYIKSCQRCPERVPCTTHAMFKCGLDASKGEMHYKDLKSRRMGCPLHVG